MKKLNCLLLFLLLPFVLGAQETGLPVSHDKKMQDFTVTGDGSSAIWNKTEWMDLVHQGSGATIDYETKVKVLYSPSGIYFLVQVPGFKADNHHAGRQPEFVGRRCC